MRNLIRLVPVLAIFFLLATFNVNGQSRTKAGQLSKVVALASVPERLTSTNLWVSSATFVGINSLRVDNTQTAYFGFSSVDDANLFPIEAGIAGAITITAPPNKSFNLFDIYIDVGANDEEILVTYFND
jgi:hypothetical protein